MTKHSTPPVRIHASGFTLTEVVVALGLFVFAITALMGVIPSGMDQVQTASNESRAMAEMESIRDDVALAITSGMASSLRYEIKTPAAGSTTAVDYKISEDGEVVTGNGAALYRVIGTVRAPAANSADPFHLHLRATWPAKAPAGKESGSVELISAFKS
jgi:uncharacterized protein (TIGR02598 family)